MHVLPFKSWVGVNRTRRGDGAAAQILFSITCHGRNAQIAAGPFDWTCFLRVYHFCDEMMTRMKYVSSFFLINRFERMAALVS